MRTTLSYIDQVYVANAGKMSLPYLSDILATMVGRNAAAYEPAKQTRVVLVYWQLPEEWAEVLYDWVC
jgi:ESCRT-II complex subunit VPS25